MSTAAFLFIITLGNTVIASISGSFLRCITCPCGSGNKNYTHCINELVLKDFTCERWSHCQTCKANTTFCITCEPGHFGPTCSEISDGNRRRKRQDDPDLLNHARYPRNPGSGRYSQVRCLNHGCIPHGRVLAFPPFDDDFDFDFPYGTILKFICDEGFVLVGEDTSRCGPKSYWTEDIPKCVGAPSELRTGCEHPGVDPNGRISNPLADSPRSRQVFSVGTELTFVCNDGFQILGATVLTCLNGGEWTSHPPQCRRNLLPEGSCPFLKRPRYGQIICTFKGNGSRTCTSRCFPDHYFEGFTTGEEITLNCEHNQWTPYKNFPECIPSDEHSRKKRQDDPTLLNHPRYPRQTGSGRHSQVRCLNHGPIPHGRVLAIPPFDDSQPDDDFEFDFPYGTILKFICDEGFVLVGEDTSRCRSNGFWTEDIPKCVRETLTPQQSCKHPGVDVNGRINNPLIGSQSSQQLFPAGTELTFVCNDGFQPDGAMVLACLSIGKWTSLPPKCRPNPTEKVVELPCRHPGKVVNSMFNEDLHQVSSFPVGTAVTFRCIEGTRRKGPMTIICQSSGKWSEPPPTCEPTSDKKR